MSASTTVPLRTAQLYSTLRGFVRRTLRAKGIGAADLDDVTHDVFLTLHRKGCAFADERSARSWLYAAASRVASNARRAATRFERRTPGWAPAEPPSSDTVVARQQAATLLTTFGASLPAPAGEVFRMSELEGLTAPQISAELGLNLNTTYSLIRRARDRFARMVAIAVVLALLALSALCSACAAEADDAGPRVAIRIGSDVGN